MSEAIDMTEPSGGAAPAEGPPSSEPSSDAAAEPSPPALAPDDGGTLAEGGGQDDVAPESPTNWPSNWREIMSGGDKKALGRLNRYQSPANVWKALSAAGQKISTGELLRSKPEGDDEAALNEWRAQAGIPDTPEGYLEKIPDGLVIGEDDKPMLDSFLQKAHSIDAPPEIVSEFIAWENEQKEQKMADQAELDQRDRATNEDTLRSEWGAEYRANLNGVHALLSTHGNDQLTERLFSARFADGSPLGDDPMLLNFLVGMNREINPHGTVTPNTGQTALQTVESELKGLESEMTDTKGREPDGYWNSEGKQARYRELVDIRDRHTARG